MKLNKGLVARSIAGRDKNNFEVVIGFDKDYVLICDGKRKTLDNPKRKNLKHLQFTNTILDGENISSDKLIREALKEYNKKTHK